MDKQVERESGTWKRLFRESRDHDSKIILRDCGALLDAASTSS